jgi:hypothetical protein
LRNILFVTALLSLLLSSVANSSFSQQASKPLYLDPDLTLERRAADLVSKMTLEEKVGADAPIRNLRGFQRIHLKAGESRQVSFTVAAEDIPKSKVEISVGGGQPKENVPHVNCRANFGAFRGPKGDAVKIKLLQASE